MREEADGNQALPHAEIPQVVTVLTRGFQGPPLGEKISRVEDSHASRYLLLYTQDITSPSR